jgi:cation transporter-like permease
MTDSQFAALFTLLLAIFCLLAGYMYREALQPDRVPCIATLKDAVGNKTEFSLMCDIRDF